MKLAICTSFDYTMPLDQAIPLIREAGFEGASRASRGVVSISAWAVPAAGKHKRI